MNMELKYIRKFSFLRLVLIHFWSGLESQINLIQSTMPEKSFPLGSPPSAVPKYCLKVGLFDNVRTLQWKGHFKFRKHLPQQLGNCAEHFVTRFLVFQPTSLEAYQSQNLLEYFNQDNLDRQCKILIFKTCQAMKLILWHHKLSLHLLITSFIFFNLLPMKENSWQITVVLGLSVSLFLHLFFS